MKSLSAETTTVSASLATWSSVYSTPFSSQTGASSSSLIGREALEMSVSPAQNFSKPPPVPEVPTETLTAAVLLGEQLAGGGGQRLDGRGAVGDDLAAAPPSPSPAPSAWPPQAARPTVRRSAAGAAAAVLMVRRFTEERLPGSGRRSAALGCLTS